MQTIEILGVRVHNVDMREVLAKVEEYIRSGRPHQICTPNVDHIVKAQKDDDFRAIINSADLAIPDGMGGWRSRLTLGKSVRTGVLMMRGVAYLWHQSLGGARSEESSACENAGRVAIPAVAAYPVRRLST